MAFEGVNFVLAQRSDGIRCTFHSFSQSLTQRFKIGFCLLGEQAGSVQHVFDFLDVNFGTNQVAHRLHLFLERGIQDGQQYLVERLAHPDFFALAQRKG